MNSEKSVLNSEQQAAATPAGTPAGNPPTPKNSPDHGRDTSRTDPGQSTATPQERYLAARYRHYHGDPYWTPEEAETHAAQSALITRSWKQGREMTRDERRLMRRYEQILQKYQDADLAAYRAALAGGYPDNMKGPGQ